MVSQHILAAAAAAAAAADNGVRVCPPCVCLFDLGRKGREGGRKGKEDV